MNCYVHFILALGTSHGIWRSVRRPWPQRTVQVLLGTIKAWQLSTWTENLDQITSAPWNIQVCDFKD